jgi:hypothetical protein
VNYWCATGGRTGSWQPERFTRDPRARADAIRLLESLRGDFAAECPTWPAIVDAAIAEVQRVAVK